MDYTGQEGTQEALKTPVRAISRRMRRTQVLSDKRHVNSHSQLAINLEEELDGDE
jgi:hypothetical protein